MCTRHFDHWFREIKRGPPLSRGLMKRLTLSLPPLSMEQKPPSFQNRGGYFQSEPLPFSLLSSPFWSVHASNGLFRKSYELDTWTKASSPRRKGGRFNRSFPLARKSVYYWRWFIATPIYFDQNILLEISLCNNEYIYIWEYRGCGK